MRQRHPLRGRSTSTTTASPTRRSWSIETLSRHARRCRRHAESGQAVSVTVDMGDAILTPRRPTCPPWRCPGSGLVGQMTVEVAGRHLRSHLRFSMGNPHCVVEWPDENLPTGMDLAGQSAL